MAGTSSIPTRGEAGHTGLGGSDLATRTTSTTTGTGTTVLPPCRYRPEGPAPHPDGRASLAPQVHAPASEPAAPVEAEPAERTSRRATAVVRETARALVEGWRRTTVVTLVAGLGPAIAVVAASTDRQLEVAGIVATVATALLMLAASSLLHAQWLLVRQPTLGWLSAAALMVSVQHLPFAAASVSGEDRSGPRGGAVDALLVLLLLVMAVLAVRGRPTPRPRPAVLGIGAGLLLCLLRSWEMRDGADTARVLDAVPATVLPIALLPVTLVSVVALLRLDALPLWARVQIGLGAFGVGLVRVTDPAVPVTDAPLALPLALGGMVCAALVVSATTGLLVDAVQRHGRELDDLSRRAEQAEAGIRRDEEVLHELRSAFGGVSTATSLLLHEARELPAAQRRRLEHLVESELDRIGHMVSPAPRCDLRLHAVDELLAPLVASQQAQGRDVRCEPTGAWLRVCGQHLAEAVSILLCNAARHAPGAAVTVTLERGPAGTRLRVTDEGPGVPEALREDLFDRGVRGEHSPGQGLGLHAARRVMREHGGDVELERTGAAGTTFVVTLPPPRHRPEQAT